MARITKCFLSLIAFVLLVPLGAWAQGTYTAVSCNYSDVNAVINGPTHTAVNGDTIVIPSGTCTWTSALSINVGITVEGAGSSATIIDDDYAGTMINVNLSSASNFLRFTAMAIDPSTSLSNGANFIMSIEGTCSSSTCSTIRLDHLEMDSWTSNNDAYLFQVDNAFGVVDHCTESASHAPFINIGLSAYQGVGNYGDNSWAQPDSYNTANALFLENNTFTNTDQSTNYITDCDGEACRYVARFNTVTNGAFENHGTESPGRKRGGRWEIVYDNNFYASSGTSVAAVVAMRSGTGLLFDNQMTWGSSAGFSGFLTPGLQRTVYSLGGWGSCDGTGPWDQNDGQTKLTGFTVSAVSGSTVTASGASWTSGEFSPGGLLYTFVDLTQAFVANSPVATILSNGTNTLTIAGADFTPAAGDSFAILGTTLYATGTMTGASGSTTLTDSSKSGASAWTANQWVEAGNPYSVVDITQGWGSEIYSNTANTITTYASTNAFGPAYGQSFAFNSGDRYALLRASVCVDQPGRGQGNLLSGSEPAIGFPNDALDPIYEWGDTWQSNPGFSQLISASYYTQRIVNNRDYYQESVSQGAQTSSSSPFTGDPSTGPGVGHGLYQYIPTTCTQNVAYWATDQGNWNQSGSGGQGELYVCTAANTWTLAYVPETYPNPITTGSGTVGGPNPPTNLTAKAN